MSIRSRSVPFHRKRHSQRRSNRRCWCESNAASTAVLGRTDAVTSSKSGRLEGWCLPTLESWSSTQADTHRERRSCVPLLLTVVLLMPACDEFPGLDAIGVQPDQSGSGFEIVKPLCPGDRVTEVSLYRAPGVTSTIVAFSGKSRPQLAPRRTRTSSGRRRLDSWRKSRSSALLVTSKSVAATIDSNFDAQGLITFKPSELRTNLVLEPDGYFGSRAVRGSSPRPMQVVARAPMWV
jgi:hypothetical protein